MSFCVLYMILCACAFILNSQLAHEDWREIHLLDVEVGTTRSELLIQKKIFLLVNLLFVTRLSSPDQEHRLGMDVDRSLLSAL